MTAADSRVVLPTSLLAVLALAALLAPATPPAGSAGSAEERPRAAGAADAVGGPMALCQERFAALAGQGYGLSYLIATLPDPLESSYGREFDLFVGSLERAMAGAGAVADRACLPWRSGSDLQRRQPGILLFRRDVPETVAGEPQARAIPGRLHVVLLVGEGPVAGVHEAALRAAFDAACGRAAAGPGAARCLTPELRLLAPTFSGALPALAVTLARWVADQGPAFQAPFFHLRSGTASATRNEERLADLLHATPPGASAPRSIGFDYASFAATNQQLEACLWQVFARDRLGMGAEPPPGAAAGDPEPEVALLAEWSSFGEDFAPRAAVAPDGGAAAGAAWRPPMIVLRFPMHISQLRAAAAQRGPQRSAAPAAAPAAPTALPVDLEAGAVGDGVPPMERTLTAPTQELVLGNVLSVVAERRLRMVVIAATHTLDKLFLAEALRRYAPDVRLVTFEGDLLLAHPDHLRSTAGMLVVSSHALVEPAPPASGGGGVGGAGERLQFASDGAQGVFEAASALLAAPVGRPSTPRSAWVSVVGRGGLQPLDECRVGPGDAQAEREPVPAAPAGLPKPPRAWSLLFNGFTVAAVALLSCAAAVLLGGGPQSGSGAPAAGARRRRVGWRRVAWRAGGPESLLTRALLFPPWDAEPSAAARVRLSLLALLPVAAGAVSYVLALPYFRGERREAPVAVWTGRVLLAAWAVAFAVLLAGLAWRTARDGAAAWRGPVGFKNALRGLGGTSLAALPLLAVALAAGSVAALLLPGADRLPEPALSLALHRAVRFSSGTSPLLPVLLALGVLLVWAGLAPVLHRVLDVLPDPGGRWRGGEGGRGAPGLRDLGDLRRALDPTAFHLPQDLAVWAFLVLVPGVYVSRFYRAGWERLLRGLEHPEHDRVMSWLLALGTTAAIASGLSVLRGWRAADRLLRWLGELRFEAGEAEEACWQRTLSRHRAAGLAGARHGRDACLAKLRQVPRAAGGPGSLQQALDASDSGEGEVPCGKEEGAAGVWLALIEWMVGRSAPAGGELRPAAAAGPPRALPEAALLDASRQFFAAQTAVVARSVLKALLGHMAFMSGALIALLIAVSSYPFEPQRVFLVYLGSLMVAGAFASTRILLGAEKDPLLSLVTGTEPGKVGFHVDLVRRLVVFAGVPLASLLASQFPVLRQLLVEWAQPLLRALG